MKKTGAWQSSVILLNQAVEMQGGYQSISFDFGEPGIRGSAEGSAGAPVRRRPVSD
jgi:hypothetical protein